MKYLCTRLLQSIMGIEDLPFDEKKFVDSFQKENEIIKAIGKLIFQICEKIK